MEKQKSLKTIRGKVVADSNDKTVVVDVERVKTHPLYRKKYSVNKRFQAHDENNEYKVGDTVDIVACRPYSKIKKYKVIKKIS